MLKKLEKYAKNELGLSVHHLGFILMMLLVLFISLATYMVVKHPLLLAVTIIAGAFIWYKYRH